MAYAALTSLLQTIEQIPQPVQQITSLQDKVSHLLLILEDSPQKSSLTINNLEGQIREASCVAEDIIEFVVSRRFRMTVEFRGLDKITHKFDSILEALSKIKDGKVEDLVRFEQDLIKIKHRVIGSSQSKLDIISIVGMGGIGKTTLARNLYNDSLVEHHFGTRAWIDVSQQYRVQEVLTGVLDSTRHCGGELNRKSIEKLADLLYKSLKGRRYLIVMDDVWDTKAWDDVKRFFPDDDNGSRIILTTRQSDVAIYANSYSPIYHMNLQSSEASWNLLRRKVFGEECCPFPLEKIGKEIAHNCKGLPLAITVIGGLLYKSSRTQDHWEFIARNLKSAVTGNDDQFMEILSLSYNSLPHHLKPCFLYIGVFPEDYEIFASQLIKLWIAEGFVKPLTSKSLEEVAGDYLKDLIDRSLVMVDKRNHNGGIKTCVIHDLLRELCVKKAQDEKFLQIMNQAGVSIRSKLHQVSVHSKPRRVSIHSNEYLPYINRASTRSLLYFFHGDANRDLLSFIVRSRLLRVLDALTIRFRDFPIEIVELVHLRYLAFIYEGKSKFPASISKLQNLQTLIVHRRESTSDILYLPTTIWKMPQLKNLVLEGSFLPYPFLAKIIGKDSVVLEKLQTLSGITNFKCTKKIFVIMPNLKKLGITYFHDRDTKWASYEFNNFVCLHQLEKLKCIFIPKNSRAGRRLPINLAFPPSLKKLTLSGCRIPWMRMTIVGSLPNLEVLKLKDHAFEGLVWVPKEGEFNKLKFLLIDETFLEQWRATDTHFPQLQHLILVHCLKLVKIPSEIGRIPTLEMVELYECSPSAVASAIRIQDEQHRLKNNRLRVRASSNLDITTLTRTSL